MLTTKYMQQEFINTFGTYYDTEESLQNFQSAQPNGYYENETSVFIIVVKEYSADFDEGLQYSKKCLRKILQRIEVSKEIFIIIATGKSPITFNYTIFKVLRETRQLQRLNTKLSQLSEMTFVIASDSGSAGDSSTQNIPSASIPTQCCTRSLLPVTRCNCDNDTPTKQFYRISAEDLYKHRLHRQLVEFEKEISQNIDNKQYWPQKTFTAPTFVRITGFSRVRVSDLFTVVGIVPVSKIQLVQKDCDKEKNKEIYRVTVNNKIIILESKLINYPNTDAFLMTIQQQLLLNDEQLNADSIGSTQIDIPTFV